MIYAEIKSFAMKHGNAGSTPAESSDGRLGWFLMIGRADGANRLDLLGAQLLPADLVFAKFAWNVLIVYLTLGFRHYSHYFTSIPDAH